MVGERPSGRAVPGHVKAEERLGVGVRGETTEKRRLTAPARVRSTRAARCLDFEKAF